MLRTATLASSAVPGPLQGRETPALSLFTDRSHYRPDQHRLLLHVLRPIWDRHDAPPASPIRLVEAIDSAVAAILPMTWHYYLEADRMRLATEMAAAAAARNRLLLVFAAGDHEPIVPFENAVVFHPGPARSLRRHARGAYALPSFVPDYRLIYFNGLAAYRQKGPRPVVGFCGHGTSPLGRLGVQALRNAWNQLQYRAGRLAVVPEPIVPAVVLRRQVLERLQRSRDVETRFVIRRDYRAGLRQVEERRDPFHPTRMEFVRAIAEADYTVCVRGGGNFSLRLYEALSLGRMPIFVDTDCVLPYDFHLAWRDLCCWIERHEVRHVAEKVADFHHALSSDEFIDRQRACRAIWETYCTDEGFYQHLHLHLRHLGVLPQASERGIVPEARWVP